MEKDIEYQIPEDAESTEKKNKEAEEITVKVENETKTELLQQIDGKLDLLLDAQNIRGE